MKYDVFISYSRKDTAIANKICDALDKQGISYFIDRQGIGGGQEFPDVLAKAIIGCRIMLYLASANSYCSKFTNNEITFAFNEKPKGSVLPYVIDGSRLPDTQRFIFASVNIRTLEEHPIDTVLMKDLCLLLGREYNVDTRNGKDRNEIKVEVAVGQSPKIVASQVDIEAPQVTVITQNQLGKNSLHLIESKKRFGYVDKSGNIVLECRWKSASDFFEGRAFVMDSKGLYGLIDINGQYIVKPQWKNHWYFGYDGLARVEDCQGRIYFIDKNGNEAFAPIKGLKMDGLWFSEGMLPVKNDEGKFGFINTRGELVIDCIWDGWSGIPCGFAGASPLCFSEGLVAVKDVFGKWGYINREGKVVIPCKWSQASYFSDGLARVKGFYNKHSRYGYINTQGNIVIPCQYKRALDFHEALAQVTLTDEFSEWGYINRKGELVFPYSLRVEYGIKCSEGLVAVQSQKNYNWGFIDVHGKLVIDYEWEETGHFHQSLVAVCNSKNKWGFINNVGKLVIPCQWKNVEHFQPDGTAWVTSDNKIWRKIDTLGRLL